MQDLLASNALSGNCSSQRDGSYLGDGSYQGDGSYSGDGLHQKDGSYSRDGEPLSGQHVQEVINTGTAAGAEGLEFVARRGQTHQTLES